ncbi:MAG: rRNA maturation RNAse YbeY [Bacteroidota bacterium]|nr:rRNA maturation RNAse YbeY [Bacteroidota bacterium]
MGSIHFFYDGIQKIPLDELYLKKFLEELIRAEGRRLKELNYIFCSDEKLLQINKQFLQRDYFTDVISFDLSEGDEIMGRSISARIESGKTQRN